ncbi:hypothetical protein OEZ85_003992 [Tetradesmus obliquus]|uniref:Protein kinase domain-containing protein n=1 Tax=Tetradesmus obliquus TaxID=3088 RepID=A0ABY8UGT4_TETOB|nr:hypothetical protein OEZ85_003992 [Tetradesmus obliquus]
MSAVMCAGDQERDVSTPGQPDLWSAFAAANGMPQQRQRSKSEQVGDGLDPWDAAQLLQGSCGHSGCSGSMSTSLSAASGSCWSSSSSSSAHQISSRPAPGGGIGEGITWIMTEYARREVLAEYEFGQTLGCGTFGVTRLVTHRRTARPWACKTICKASIAASPAAVSDVQHEVAILQHLAGHAGIVQLQGVYEDERNIHLVMELCTGGDLLDYISRFQRLSEAEAADIGRVMLTTLQHCHRNGVVHRDIKPENFLLGAPTLLMAPAGSAAAVLKISDFGVSAFHTPGEHFAEIVGTPFYMAPEVLERCYGPAADVWSVGVVIYLMIAGCLPFNGNTDRQIIKAVMDSEPDFQAQVAGG